MEWNGMEWKWLAAVAAAAHALPPPHPQAGEREGWHVTRKKAARGHKEEKGPAARRRKGLAEGGRRVARKATGRGASAGEGAGAEGKGQKQRKVEVMAKMSHAGRTGQQRTEARPKGGEKAGTHHDRANSTRRRGPSKEHGQTAKATPRTKQEGSRAGQ